MTVIDLNRRQYLELDKICIGAFRPLDGFMNEDEFRSVVDTMRLPNGSPFPLPIVLDISHEIARKIAGNSSVSLTHGGIDVGSITPESIYTCDKTDVAFKIFGTSDERHPGVAHLLRMGTHFVGGPVTVTERLSLDNADMEITPDEARKIFKSRGWKTIVGFQTRNVPHRAHEYLQRVGMELVDGLFIQPLIGRKRRGDYTPEAIMAGYRALIRNFYPPGKVLLGTLSTFMRYAGPREAVFHAIIRRNYGCTHFIVGRDHAGVGSYYGIYDAHEMTRRFEGQLGIEVLRLHGPFYCKRCDSIATDASCAHLLSEPSATTEISGTLMRSILTSGERPPPHLMRAEVVDALRGIQLFIDREEE